MVVLGPCLCLLRVCDALGGVVKLTWRRKLERTADQRKEDDDIILDFAVSGRPSPVDQLWTDLCLCLLLPASLLQSSAVASAVASCSSTPQQSFICHQQDIRADHKSSTSRTAFVKNIPTARAPPGLRVRKSKSQYRKISTAALPCKGA